MKNLLYSWKNNNFPPPRRDLLIAFVRRAAQLAHLPDFDWNFEIEFTDDELMTRRNMELLGHEGTTDVITFSYFTGDGDDFILENETAIDAVVNPDAAFREGSRRKNSYYARETALYVVHALLHSSGLEDIEPEDRRRMRANERRVMKKLEAEGVVFQDIFPLSRE